MSRVRKSNDEPIGQDSFMDVVSNLVGILIILVMVVGMRAKDALVHAESTMPEQQDLSVQSKRDDVVAAKTAEQNVEADIHRISRQLKHQELEIDYRQMERDRAQLLVTAAEQAVSDGRKQLDDSQRAEFDRRTELASAESELGELRRGIGHLESTKPQTIVIEHLPTPMAKTVFGKELHLRLRAGRLAYVPWDEFIQLLKEDMPKKAWRLKDQDELSELVGPAGGFWMRYTLKRQTHLLPTKAGVATQQTVELDRFTLVPESEQMGEPVDEALQAGSRLSAVLSNYRPESSTVTVWTYPDSFNDFRTLKNELFRRGFVTAARPLPADQPIGGSPDGTRSAAQ
jgi:hypothetical protein